MKPVDRQKVCPQCDGRIALDAKECIYCGAEQSKPQASPASTQFKQVSAPEQGAALYAPPYASRSQQGAYTATGDEGAAKKGMGRTGQAQAAALASESAGDERALQGAKGDFYLILFFLSGTALFTLGCLQFFFAEDGLLQLEWNSSYWFLYCLAALPLLYLGWKRIQKES